MMMTAELSIYFHRLVGNILSSPYSPYSAFKTVKKLSQPTIWLSQEKRILAKAFKIPSAIAKTLATRAVKHNEQLNLKP